MKRRNFLKNGIIGCATTSLIPSLSLANTWSPERSYLLADMTRGYVIQSFNPKNIIYPASITKLMTMDIVFSCLKKKSLKLDNMLSMTQYSSLKAPTKLGLKPGEQISVLDACKAVAVHSCNDIASLFSEYIAGNESKFTDYMNIRAKEYDMENTHFLNCTGLPEQKNVSTAYDIARLTLFMFSKYPEYMGFFGLKEWSWNGKKYLNSNHLMAICSNMYFCKTGYIHASGFNLVSSIVKNNTKYLGIITGCHSTKERDKLMLALYNQV
jgi:D-alanyl-D-alanine carboxypeptidase